MQDPFVFMGIMQVSFSYNLFLPYYIILGGGHVCPGITPPTTRKKKISFFCFFFCLKYTPLCGDCVNVLQGKRGWEGLDVDPVFPNATLVQMILIFDFDSSKSMHIPI